MAPSDSRSVNRYSHGHSLCKFPINVTVPRTAPRPAISFAYYIDVRDVDRLYAELKPKLDTLPKGDVYGPVDQSYGQRELLVLAPDGNLLAFGQAIGGE